MSQMEELRQSIQHWLRIYNESKVSILVLFLLKFYTNISM